MTTSSPRSHRLVALFRSSPRSNPSMPKHPSPALHIPEIVENILVYLVCAAEALYLPLPYHRSSDDHEQPKRPDIFREYRSQWWFPLMVCKQWLAIGTSLQPMSAYWRDTHGSVAVKAIEACQRRALKLHLAFGPVSSSFLAERARRWHAFQQLLEDVDAHGTFTQDWTTEGRAGSGDFQSVFPKGRVRELFMSDIPSVRYVSRALSVFTCRLTLLDLEFARPTDLDIWAILRPENDGTGGEGGNDDDDGKGYDNLTGSPSSSSSSSLSSSTHSPLESLHHLSLSNVVLPSIPLSWKLPYESQLETFRLNSVFSGYQSLCQLLFALCRPSLRSLRLGSIQPPARLRPVHALYYFSVFDLAHLASISPNLATLSLRCRSVASMVDVQRLTLLFDQLRVIRLENPFLTMTAIREYVLVSDPALNTTASSSSSSSSSSIATPTAATAATASKQGKAADTLLQLAIVRLDIENDTTGYRSFETYGLHCFLKTPAAAHIRELIAPNLLYVERWDMTQWTCKDKLEILAARPDRRPSKERRACRLPSTDLLLSMIKDMLKEKTRKIAMA
ncbi:hypothetical protein BGZ73_008740 [Actinomortierella ambigua]|nr:hypothetical protein BGZ73_008740 [Actinomortierella ambigua]